MRALLMTPKQSWWWWQPWVNTVLYYDFEHTSWTTETDVSWNYNATYNTTPTIWTLSSWKKYFDTEWSKFLTTNNTLSNLNYSNCTVSVRMNIQNRSNRARFWQVWRSIPNTLWTIFLETTSSWPQICLWINNCSFTTSNTYLQGWTNVVFTHDGTTFKFYSNWTLINSKNGSAWTWNRKFLVGKCEAYDGGNVNVWDSWFGSVIIENQARTAQEVANYYDQTKSLYWIS